MPTSDSEDFESADEGHGSPDKKERKKRLSSSNYSDNALETEQKASNTNTSSSNVQKVVEKVKEADGWDDFDIDDAEPVVPQPAAKSKGPEKAKTKPDDKPSVSKESQKSEDTGWDEFDDWGTEEVSADVPKAEPPKPRPFPAKPITTQPEPNIQEVTDRLAAASAGGGSSWGWGWSVDSLLSSATAGISSATAGISNITSQVSQVRSLTPPFIFRREDRPRDDRPIERGPPRDRDDRPRDDRPRDEGGWRSANREPVREREPERERPRYGGRSSAEGGSWRRGPADPPPAPSERSSAWRSKDAPPREDRFRDAPRDRDRGDRDRDGGFRDRDRDRFPPRRDDRDGPRRDDRDGPRRDDRDGPRRDDRDGPRRDDRDREPPRRDDRDRDGPRRAPPRREEKPRDPDGDDWQPVTRR